MTNIDRRRFIAGATGTMLAVMSGEWAPVLATGKKARVSLTKDIDRQTAVKNTMALLESNPVKGKAVLLKPNFNTADPFPAGTHNDTLQALIENLWAMGAKRITIGERSDPPDTVDVLKEKAIPQLCRKLEVELINFEELPARDWVHVRPAHSHWRDGFLVARPVLDAECVVTTCCLKTHRYGGVFTMSLKLSVGITHKKNMRELHGSFRSMRKMIAEINQVYEPALILMDGLEVFTDGGPMHGEQKKAGVMVAGHDRVAIDGVGLAVLKEQGANRAIMDNKIFAQEQMARAVELGLGVTDPAAIEIITGDAPSQAYADKLRAILRAEAT